jgi:hypothetical protein
MRFAMSDPATLIFIVIACLVIGWLLLAGILAVWPLSLVLVVAGYLVGGGYGVVGGLLIAGLFGAIVVIAND